MHWRPGMRHMPPGLPCVHNSSGTAWRAFHGTGASCSPLVLPRTSAYPACRISASPGGCLPHGLKAAPASPQMLSGLCRDRRCCCRKHPLWRTGGKWYPQDRGDRNSPSRPSLRPHRGGGGIRPSPNDPYKGVRWLLLPEPKYCSSELYR